MNANIIHNNETSIIFQNIKESLAALFETNEFSVFNFSKEVFIGDVSFFASVHAPMVAIELVSVEHSSRSGGRSSQNELTMTIGVSIVYHDVMNGEYTHESHAAASYAVYDHLIRDIDHLMLSRTMLADGTMSTTSKLVIKKPEFGPLTFGFREFLGSTDNKVAHSSQFSIVFDRPIRVEITGNQ